MLDESFSAFNGAGYDLEWLLDSSGKLSRAASGVIVHTRALVDDGAPFLDAQAQTADKTRRWAHNLAGFTDQMVSDDSQFRKLLHTGPGFEQEVSPLLDQLKPALPVFLANLSTIGQIGVTYHPALEQLLVLPPPVGRGLRVLRRHQQPDRFGGRRLHPDHRRPAGVHGRVPAAVAMALARRHE